MAKSKAFPLKRVLISVIAVVLVIAIVVGILLVARSRGSVNVYPAWYFTTDADDAFESDTDGVVTADKIQSVYISSTQQVTEIYVEEGQTVEIGDPILAYDTTLSQVELDRQAIAVQQLELELAAEEANLVAIGNYAIGTGGGYYVISGSGGTTVTVPYLKGGSGTADDPYVWMVSESMEFTDDMVQYILSSSVSSTEEAEEDEASGEIESESDGRIYVVFEVRSGNVLTGTILNCWEMAFRQTSATGTGWVFSVVETSYEADDEDDGDVYVYDTTVYYTAAEVAQLKAESQQRITDLTLELKMAQLEYEQLEYELSNGVVYATVAGTVKTVRDPDEALAEDSAVVLISGGGGYYVTGVLGEFDRTTLSIGDTVTLYSWTDWEEVCGTVVEISDYPVEDEDDYYYYTDGNTNVSLYPFTVMIDEDANLREGEYVDIYITTSEDDDSIYLYNPFLRTENGQSYIWVATEDGTLEKRYVTTGKSLWGYYTQIISGLSEDDYIAFPYGSGLREGAKVTYQDDTDALYGY